MPCLTKAKSRNLIRPKSPATVASVSLNTDYDVPGQEAAYQWLRRHFDSHADDLEQRVADQSDDGLHGFAWSVICPEGTLYVVGASRISHHTQADLVELQVQHIALVAKGYVPDARKAIDWQSNLGMRIRLEFAARRFSAGGDSGEVVCVYERGQSLSHAEFRDVAKAVDQCGHGILRVTAGDAIDLHVAVALMLVSEGQDAGVVDYTEETGGRAERYVDFVPVTELRTGPRIAARTTAEG
jgi:hypothetical protein